MEDLKRIRTFVKVVEMGSFSAAAGDDLAVSSVARQIKALEDELDARLINRNSRRLSLTEAGERLFARMRPILAELDTAKEEIHSLQDEVKGTLRVALRVSAGTTVVIPALPAFLAKFPELSLDIIMTDDRKELIANKIDVAIWLGELPDSDIIARRLTNTRRIVSASAEYAQRHGIPVSPQDLSDHKCLYYTALTYGPIWSFRKGDEAIDVRIGGSVRCDNGPSLLALARMGLGLVALPEWMLRPYLSDGSMLHVLADYAVQAHAGQAEHYVVYPSSKGLSRKVRVFVDFLVETFAGAEAECR
jgi:DNA-binding transcriptional LysR family regulator